MLGGQIHLMGGVAVGGAEDGRDTGGIEAVLEVMLLELVGGGDGDGTQLIQTQHGEPELVVALQHQHDAIALLDTQGLEVVGALGGGLLHVLEGESPLGVIAGDVEHSQLLGILLGQGVHQIEGKVELVGVLELDGGRRAQSVLGDVDEFAPDAVAIVSLIAGGDLLLGGGDGLRGGQLGDGLTRGIEDDGVEHAVLTAHGDHTVRGVGVVVDGVACAQHLGMLAHLHHELTLNDDIQLLSRVGGQLDILVLGLLGVGGAHEQGLCDTVLEGVGHVVVHHAVSLGDLLSRSCAGDGVGLQLGAVALDDLGDVDVERQGATVDEGEVEVALAALTADVLLGGDTRLGGHLRGLQALDLAEGADTPRHLLDLEIQSGHGGGFHRSIRLIHV